MDKCPLTGLPCSNPKVIHITDVGPNYLAEKSYDLCQICAGEQPPKLLPFLSAVKNFLSILSDVLMEKINQNKLATKPPANSKEPCPSCGTTVNDIVSTSRLGCPYCYEHYKKELQAVLIHAHKAVKHVGKVPKPKVPENLPLNEQIRLLEAQIVQAADQELYEKAKELHDKLIYLKSSLRS